MAKLNLLKLKNYALLAESAFWQNNFKPDLEKIKDLLSKSEAEPNTEFDAIKRDICRSNTNKIINQIISLVEKAERKVNKTYAKNLEADDVD